MKKFIRDQFFILILTPFLFLNCDCGPTEELTRICPEETACFIDDNGEVQRTDKEIWERFDISPSTPCSLGVTKCDQASLEVTCEGYNPPHIAGTLEICDGIDNDCNFKIDEALHRSFLSPLNTCPMNSGGCISSQICQEGSWQCVLMTPARCGDEVCDGIDNDADGLVDQEDPSYSQESKWYWPEDSFPSSDISFGPESRCSPGRIECINGEEQVRNLFLPIVEQCGNNIDDDCDGVVDEVENPDFTGAFVFVFDASGSMGATIQAVAQAACSFSQNNILTGSKFAVEWVGLAHLSAVRQVMHGLDFTDSTGLCDYLSAEPWIQVTGSQEYQLLGILAPWYEYPFLNSDGSAAGTTTQLLTDTLNWPSDLPKQIVVFTDEPMQIFEDEEGEVIDKCLAQPFSIGVFTTIENWDPWYYFISECGGFISSLYTSGFLMEKALLEHLTGDC